MAGGTAQKVGATRNERAGRRAVERRVDVLGRRKKTAIRLFINTIINLKHITPNNAFVQQTTYKNTHMC